MTSGRRLPAVAAALLLMMAVLGVPAHGAYNSATAVAAVPVLIVGGSAAVGWVDDTGLGYVERGFLRYGEQAGMDFAFTNHAIPGARVVNPTVARRYGGWVSALGPGGMVVLAWGLLNDVRLKTPLAVLKRRIRRQIRVALAHSDLVILVTPPATRASFERERSTEHSMVRAEIREARSFHSRRVYIADVFDQETSYLTAHHLSYRPYMAGRWDPNTSGHALAGRLLGGELRDALPARRVLGQVRALMASRGRAS